MTVPLLTQITAISDNSYEVVLEDGQAQYRSICTVEESGVVPIITSEPSIFFNGDFGDPRRIMAAVRAMHVARTEAAT